MEAVLLIYNGPEDGIIPTWFGSLEDKILCVLYAAAHMFSQELSQSLRAKFQTVYRGISFQITFAKE